jgi:hypothetical protein
LSDTFSRLNEGAIFENETARPHLVAEVEDRPNGSKLAISVNNGKKLFSRDGVKGVFGIQTDHYLSFDEGLLNDERCCLSSRFGAHPQLWRGGGELKFHLAKSKLPDELVEKAGDSNRSHFLLGFILVEGKEIGVAGKVQNRNRKS